MENPTEPIVQNIVRAFHWQQMIDNGEFSNAKELALAAGRDSSYVARTLRLTMLCPEIIHAVLSYVKRKKIFEFDYVEIVSKFPYHCGSSRNTAQ